MTSAINGRSSGVISNRSIDQARELKVIVVGAGVSGILSAIKLQNQVQKLNLTIYEKNEDLGGTWWENKYPGCACDIPAHCYQLSFESNPGWSQFYATAPEILEYWRKVTAKYGVRKYMKFSSAVTKAQWNDESAKWKCTIKDKITGVEVTDEADVLITAIGILNEWRWPEIVGLHDFKGDLLHSANWDPKFQHQGKRVAVIGAGSSGIQIVPCIQPEVQRLDHYVRGKTWIATPMASHEVEKRTAGTGSNFKFSKEEIHAWLEDPALYLNYRHALETELQSGHAVTMRDSVIQTEAKREFTTLMKDRLAAKPEIAEYLLPDFSPLCKRLTPGPGYLEALTLPNVDVITNPIGKITEKGIVNEDGTVREVDAIICATGFDTIHQGRFPIYGQNGLPLRERWAEREESYLSMTTDSFPNLFMLLGPNSALGRGNLLVMLEHMAAYAARCVEKMQLENVRSMMPSRNAVLDFTDFCDTYFVDTVYSEDCSSWYKADGHTGRVAKIWPGSSLHAIQALRKPRWEDFEYTYVDENRFGWFGDGWSERDRKELDRAYYLKHTMLGMPLNEQELESKAP